MSLIISVKVVPSSGKQKIILDKSNMLKIYLKNPPEDGKANKELISYISEILKITKDNITILSGLTSRSKRIKIDKDINYQQLLDVLNIPVQIKIV